MGRSKLPLRGNTRNMACTLRQTRMLLFDLLIGIVLRTPSQNVGWRDSLFLCPAQSSNREPRAPILQRPSDYLNLTCCCANLPGSRWG
jgi:hypothetical protein